jgi:hypothetical protein
MTDLLRELLKQPFWVLMLLLGAAFVAFPCVTVNKEFYWTTHGPKSLWPMIVGIALTSLSVVSFGYTLWSKRVGGADDVGGLDLSRVKEDKGALWTTVAGCEIRVVEGRIENYPVGAGAAVALPCNEYFEDDCVKDPRSALGAYVGRVFEGQVDDFVSLMRVEAVEALGPGVERRTRRSAGRVSAPAGAYCSTSHWAARSRSPSCPRRFSGMGSRSPADSRICSTGCVSWSRA